GGDAGGAREGQRSGDAAADEPAVADRLLDPALAGGGDDDRDGGEPESGDQWKLAVDGCRGQDDDRPVPQVQRVGDPSEVAHRGEGEQPARERRDASRTAGDDEGRTDRRQEGRGSGERGRLLEEDA